MKGSGEHLCEKVRDIKQCSKKLLEENAWGQCEHLKNWGIYIQPTQISTHAGRRRRYGSDSTVHKTETGRKGILNCVLTHKQHVFVFFNAFVMMSPFPGP